MMKLYFFSSWRQVEEDDDSEFHYLEQEILFIAISGIFNKRYPLYPMRGRRDNSEKTQVFIEN